MKHSQNNLKEFLTIYGSKSDNVNLAKYKQVTICIVHSLFIHFRIFSFLTK